VLDKQRAIHDRLKNMKLDTALLQWTPHLSTSAVELEESRVEIEVSVKSLLSGSVNKDVISQRDIVHDG